MKKWRVFASGKRPVRVEARTPYSAAVKAIKTRRIKKMGYLLRVETVPPTVAWYISSIKVCKSSGLWRE